MGNRKLLLIVAIVLALAVIAAAVLLLSGRIGKKDARSLTVYRLEGSAEIAREGEGALPAETNMALRSGDRVRTAADSSLYVNMDGSRYVFADSETDFLLETGGNARDNRTVLTLDRGTLMLHVMSALSAKSEFAVKTADARFDVRGTSLRVDVSEGGTSLYVFDGKVAVTPASGGDAQVFTRGQLVRLTGGAITSVADDIDYEKMSLEALSFLNVAAEKGKILSVSAAELQEIIAHNGGLLLVKFTVGGDVFGTQTVAYGEHAHAPKLMPAPEGDWDFDFSTPITKDTAIVWKG